MLDMPQVAIRTQRAEATCVVWARRLPKLATRTNMQVRAVIALRTYPIPTVLLALPLIPQIKGMREFARVAFLAESALVVLADQMSYT